MPANRLSREDAQATIDVIHECLEEGFPWEPRIGTRQVGAKGEAMRRLGMSRATMENRLLSAKATYGLEPDPSREKPKVIERQPAPFTLDGLPEDGEPDAEDLIAMLSARHAKRKALDDAMKLRQVHVHMPGPIGLAFFGDPHVDDPGCAWGDLERDVRICRETEGLFAINLGDTTNNWVGRLMGLYANQEVTSKQALKLIEWVLTSLPWLMTVGGNHDTWNTQKGDVAEVIHRLQKLPGMYENVGARLQINLPTGQHVRVNVRHDFPGGSQFNPAHALVRETLFGFRDHILACGHRHHAGYIPVFHNDPVRLCHGFRVGTYKDMDSYAKEKGFHDGNWARSMAAVINPDYGDDPVRFIRPFFSLEEAAEYLTWRRGKWNAGKSAA